MEQHIDTHIDLTQTSLMPTIARKSENTVD